MIRHFCAGSKIDGNRLSRNSCRQMNYGDFVVRRIHGIDSRAGLGMPFFVMGKLYGIW